MVNGLLSFVHSLEDDYGGIDGLAGIWSVVTSPDGEHVYTTSIYDDAIAIFARSETDGALSQLGMVTNGDAGIERMWGPKGAAMNSDGTAMVVVDGSSGVRALSREASTGSLSLVDHEASAPGLEGAVGIAADFSPCVFVAGNLAQRDPVDAAGRAESDADHHQRLLAVVRSPSQHAIRRHPSPPKPLLLRRVRFG